MSKFGEWESISTIGSGGQAEVLKVKNKTTQAFGALKLWKNKKRLERFQREIEVAKKIRHPALVRLLEANIDTEPFYAVFEYIPGQSLDRISQADLLEIPIEKRLNWVRQISHGIEALHEANIIHRDIKPANILISEDLSSATICDFGLAYSDDDDDERFSATMEQVGSRFYIAPECEAGRVDEVTPAIDVYSLGKVLYYVMAGKIFAREQYRNIQYDLSLILDPYAEHINRLLDESIMVDVNRGSITSFIQRFERAAKCFIERLPCAGVIETYRCVFCGVGKYIAAATTKNAQSAGYTHEGNVGSQFMAFYECNNCGNCQRFKVKYGAERWFAQEYREYQSR